MTTKYIGQIQMMSYAVIEVYGKTFEGENLHGCKLERK